jgi:D-xylose 1-dehydrogenase (NADP+, D-xylono-1,5-lactone-forming)
VPEKVLNWGLLSTAHINRALIPAIRASQRNRLVAVASRSGEKAEAYAQQWGIGRALGSYEALLADPDIDVVYNSLPNHLHAEWSIRALRAGKHVLCEKPLALTLAEVDAMADAARESARVLAEAFMYRHHPQTLKVQEMVQSGQLGTLRHIHGAFTYTLTREGDIRLEKEMGGGSIWDVGCYPISYARMLAGSEPAEVFGWQTTDDDGTEMTFVGQLRFPGPAYAQFESSFIWPYQSHMTVIGSDAILEVPKPFKPRPRETMSLRRGDEVETIEVEAGELYQGEVEDMADAILLGKAPRISLADSKGTVATILALIESAETGSAVKRA